MIEGVYHRTAEQVRRTRRLRDEVFADRVEGFGEPAFDMMLALFVAGLEDRAVPPAELVDAAGVGDRVGTIWLRWISERGLVVDVAGDLALSEHGDSLVAEFLDREAIARMTDTPGGNAPDA